jgi:hypothetical protein
MGEGQRITPDLIVERHEKFPNATRALIESYAFQEYKKAVSDLLRFGKIVEVEHSDVALIVLTKSDLKEWTDFRASHWYLNLPYIKDCL